MIITELPIQQQFKATPLQKGLTKASREREAEFESKIPEKLVSVEETDEDRIKRNVV